MTTPVQAYALIGPDGVIDPFTSPQRQDVTGSVNGRWKCTPVTILPTEQYVAMVAVITAFIDEWVDYMNINNLGDAEKQHNVKWARAVLAALKDLDHG